MISRLLVCWFDGLRVSVSPPRLQLTDHPLNLDRLLSVRLGAKFLKCAGVLGLQGLFACFDQHPAFHPHLHPLCRSEVGALGHKGRREPGITGAQGLVVERLRIRKEREKISIGLWD